jgi:hypothetical protein
MENDIKEMGIKKVAIKCLKDPKYIDKCREKKEEISKTLFEELGYNTKLFEKKRKDNEHIDETEHELKYSDILNEFLKSGIGYNKWKNQEKMFFYAVTTDNVIIKYFITNSNLLYDIGYMLLKLYKKELNKQDKRIIKKELLKYVTLYEEEERIIAKVLQKLNLEKN